MDYHYPIKDSQIGIAYKNTAHSSDYPSKLLGFPNVGTHTGEWYDSNAIDFVGRPNKTLVLAVVSGKLHGIKPNQGNGDHYWGWNLYLSGDDGSEWFYTHITKPYVFTHQEDYTGIACNGKSIKAGQKIAKVASSKSGITPHLHIAKQHGGIVNALLR